MSAQQLSIGDLVTNEVLRPHFAKQQKRAAKESPEDKFAFQCRAYKLPSFMGGATKQCYFAKAFNGRQWRFDFAWPQFMVAVELEGLVVKKIGTQTLVMGAHATITGMREDMEKYNCAVLLRWHVLRFEQTMVNNGTAIDTTMRVLNDRGWKP